jgi:hypothetical protein
MSGQEKNRQEDGAPSPSPAEEPEKSKPEPAKPGLKYVFKISPADPKSSFDFEDVADK